ncbi:hypothetical protein MAE02_64460 [Microvirga aerophila]|uniref:Uncharacterized protein n=1 Tax=Microvirga aerophila TaxID=670291 RepID=A0A512C3H2_9HYPH|nr:hypothetical protein MAE02_64460 [Microvirga aerophila]
MLNQRVTGKFPTISDRHRSSQKKTAVPAGPRNGGDNLVEKLGRTSKAEDRAKAPRLASVRLKGLFTDEGYFFGWEVAQ